MWLDNGNRAEAISKMGIKNREIIYLGHIMRKQGSENLTLTRHIDGQRGAINSK